jgi:hypothetical protein
MDGREHAGSVVVDVADVVDLDPVRAALAEAYRQGRDRIEAVAYMERHELLDAVERVGRALDQHLAEAVAGSGLETIDQAALFGEAYAAIGLDLPVDVVEHIRAGQVSAWRLAAPRAEAAERLAAARASGARLVLRLPVAARGAEEPLLRHLAPEGGFDEVVTGS